MFTLHKHSTDPCATGVCRHALSPIPPTTAPSGKPADRLAQPGELVVGEPKPTNWKNNSLALTWVVFFFFEIINAEQLLWTQMLNNSFEHGDSKSANAMKKNWHFKRKPLRVRILKESTTYSWCVLLAKGPRSHLETLCWDEEMAQWLRAIGCSSRGPGSNSQHAH